MSDKNKDTKIEEPSLDEPELASKEKPSTGLMDFSELSKFLSPEEQYAKLEEKKRAEEAARSEKTKKQDSDTPEKEDEPKLEDEEDLEKDLESDLNTSQERSAPMPMQPQGGGGQASPFDAAAQGVAGTILGTTGAIFKGLSMGKDALESRTMQLQKKGLKHSLSSAQAARDELMVTLNTHNNKYREISDGVNRIYNSNEMKKRFSNSDVRRRKSVEEYAQSKPEMFTNEALSEYKNSIQQIKDNAQSYAGTIEDLSGRRAAMKAAGEDEKKVAKGLLEESVSPGSPLEKAGNAATMNGKEDEGLKKRIKEMMDKIMNAVKMALKKVFSVILGRDLKQEGPAPN